MFAAIATPIYRSRPLLPRRRIKHHAHHASPPTTNSYNVPRAVTNRLFARLLCAHRSAPAASAWNVAKASASRSVPRSSRQHVPDLHRVVMAGLDCIEKKIHPRSAGKNRYACRRRTEDVPTVSRACASAQRADADRDFLQCGVMSDYVMTPTSNSERRLDRSNPPAPVGIDMSQGVIIAAMRNTGRAGSDLVRFACDESWPPGGAA